MIEHLGFSFFANMNAMEFSNKASNLVCFPLKIGWFFVGECFSDQSNQML
jgi:hypothetical protein